MPEAIQLVAGNRENGSPVYEEVLVERRAANEFELLKSPGFVLGLAAGDVFARNSDGSFTVVKRGGNICVLLYAAAGLQELQSMVSPALMAIGGRLDGMLDGVLSYSVPVKIGFPALEKVLNAVVADAPSVEWYYGNVYDPVDGVTPLNWW